MNIAPISFNYPQKNNTSFSANKKQYEISKRWLEARRPHVTTKLSQVAATIPAIAVSVIGLDEIIKSGGVTYYKQNNSNINIAAGYNGGFYTLKSDAILPEDKLKEFVAQAFIHKNISALGGLANYINMVKDIKRQDIIMQGLKIHTYELNYKLPEDAKKFAAYHLAKASKQDINETDLFFIDNEAFYYNKLFKTAYGINMDIRNKCVQPTIRVCKFITDNKNNAIGYSVNDWDSYTGGTLDKEYTEQQEPSERVSSVVEPENNKHFAEAFRFGNAQIHNNHKVKLGIPKVLEHLKTRVKVKGADESVLQFVKFYDKNKEVQTRICYYDPTIGRSFVYSPEGKYLHQMEYNKDSKGNIYAALKFLY